MVLHPAGPIAASIMALAERTPVKGEDFLLALVLGLEVECRLTRAIAVPPAQCDVGWYLTGLTGGIGAAAAAGKLMGLSAEQIVWACGIACGQGSGFRGMHGSMCSPLVPAHAGHTGLRAAFMAAKGSVGSAAKQPDMVIQVIVGKDDGLELKTKDGSDAVSLDTLAKAVRQAQSSAPPNAAAVVISADKTVQYERVVKVMDTLQRAGIARIGLSVQLAP
jgi:2-methylcitrate dehydratase PrpD